MAHVAPRYIAHGGMTVDNVITADGQRLIGVCGGNAFYSAVGMRVWDDDVGMVGKVGEDYPSHCLEALTDLGLDIGGVRHIPGPHALRVAFAYRPDGTRTRTVPPALLAAVPAAERHHFVDTTFDDRTYLAFSPEIDDIPPGWVAAAHGYHLPALRFTTHQAITKHVRDVNPEVALTIDSPWYEGSDIPGEDLDSVLRRASAVLPSEQDLRIIWPDLSPLAAGAALRARGARVAIVKLGAEGSLVVDETGRAWAVPAVRARAVELTGAGDAFCGGFLVGLVATGDPVRAACYGTVSASFVVETTTPLQALAHIDREEAALRLEDVGGRVTALSGATV